MLKLANRLKRPLKLSGISTLDVNNSATCRSFNSLHGFGNVGKDGRSCFKNQLTKSTDVLA